jgi:DNA-binding response OmpR family regulator
MTTQERMHTRDVPPACEPDFDIARVLTKARILVVDDNEQSGMLVRCTLERFGFEHVQTTKDAREAVGITHGGLPDVVVLDVHMPMLDGFGVLREMKLLDHAGLRPGVVAVSGDASDTTRRAMLWAGADDFVVRPCPGAELARRVARVGYLIGSERRALLRAGGFEQRMREALGA